MSERPSDWANPYETWADCGCEQCVRLEAAYTGFEAGADSILPWAKAEGRRELEAQP